MGSLHWTGAETVLYFHRWSSAPASERWSVMWPRDTAIEEFPYDSALLAHLAANGVLSRRLPAEDRRRWEFEWRQVYQKAFVRGQAFRTGAKAVYAYLGEPVTSWLLVPFLSGVPGTSVHVVRPTAGAFECVGPLQEFGDFINIEFFVAPADLSWTFVRTHEDFMLGGPYFARADPARSRGTPVAT